MRPPVLLLLIIAASARSPCGKCMLKETCVKNNLKLEGGTLEKWVNGTWHSDGKVQSGRILQQQDPIQAEVESGKPFCAILHDSGPPPPVKRLPHGIVNDEEAATELNEEGILSKQSIASKQSSSLGNSYNTSHSTARIKLPLSLAVMGCGVAAAAVVALVAAVVVKARREQRNTLAMEETTITPTILATL